MTNKIVLLLFLLIFASNVQAVDQFGLIRRDRPTAVAYNGKYPVIQTAIDMLLNDAKQVAKNGFIRSPKVKNGNIVVGVAGQDAELDKLLSRFKVDISDVKGQWEGFQLQVVQQNKESYLLVIGSDAHGAAYGVLELSRLIGVSPWVWWADAVPERKEEVFLPTDFKDIQRPSVQYRGIFLNDEDWGLTPWSAGTFEPEAKVREGIDPDKTKKMQTIGPKTYSKIFELLLRLRANTIWPAMHEVTVPFYFVQGNREAAEKYGIYIGSSHCEPLARNSATECDIVGEGHYNYVTNRESVLSYWSDRLKELGNSNNIFTMGMRGKHDGKMEGVQTIPEYKDAIDKVLVDQTELLKKYIDPDPSKIPQVVIPYKEILDVYRAGMNVPDYATLMWCDDNYGYITHFPDAAERNRRGGNGIYYHISYWGRPHDYLWLSTMSPALIHQQMRKAYDHEVRKIWIVNVGDIKPGEYQTELFLDMAWDIDKVNGQGVDVHLLSWLKREFGEETGTRLLPVMQEHYRLAHIRKPEFMGNTREEEADRAYYRTVRDLPWSERQVRSRIDWYKALSDKVEHISGSVPATKQDAFFQLVKYPVLGAAEMNYKMLNAQLARHSLADWQQSHDAFDRIVALTDSFDKLNGGKWRNMMSYKPRNLPVFERVKEEVGQGDMVEENFPLLALNGTDFKGTGEALESLGYEGKAVSVAKGTELSYDLPNFSVDSLTVEVRLLPTHPVAGGDLRFGIALNDGPVQEISYKTQGRSEEWKQNVLRNQAIRICKFAVNRSKNHRLRLVAIDEGVVLDQVLIF